jgi:hypothetical protein
MLLVGLVLIALAAAAMKVALPRNGQVRGFVSHESLESAVSFAITGGIAVGLILTFVGIGRL